MAKARKKAEAKGALARDKALIRLNVFDGFVLQQLQTASEHIIADVASIKIFKEVSRNPSRV